MKHHLKFLFLIIILFAACGEKEQEITVQSIALSQPSAELVIGETLSLKATVSPSNASYDGITWTSTKTSVATVSGSGQVSALAEGNTTVTAMAGGKTASCSVTVVKGYVAVSSISLNKESLELVEGETETLTASVSPEDATDKTVSWSSSDTGVVTVKEGTITAVKVGEATINATAGGKTALCKVIVTKKVIPVEKVSLDNAELSLIVGESAALVATIEPENATDKNISWSSSDESIARVNSSGIVSAKAAGNATITAQADDKSASCTIHVSNDPKDEAIVFADNKLKAYLVSAFDNNKDGELSYNEAAAVSSGDELKKAFGEIKSFTSFDEFQFFTGLSAIPDYLFDGWTNLASIVIPNSITTIGAYSFRGCTQIVNISILGPLKVIAKCAFYDNTSLKTFNIPQSVTTIGGNAFYGCSGLSAITIPEMVTELGGGAFAKCTGLSSIVIPGNVSSIKSSTFFNCTGLTNVRIMEGVKSIEKQAFFRCTELSTVTLPESLTKIGEAAFGGCTSLTSINIPSGVTEIWDEAFGNTCLASVIIPKGVIHIGSNPFIGDSALVSLVVEQGNLVYDSRNKCNAIIETSSNVIISGCQTTIIPDSVSKIGDYAFYEIGDIDKIVIPDSVTHIGVCAFANLAALTQITVSKSITSIESIAFMGCTSLTNVVLPESLTNLGTAAFDGCTSLSSIILLSRTPPSIKERVFSNTNNAPIYVPAESLEAYISAEYWSTYATRIQAIQE